MQTDTRLIDNYDITSQFDGNIASLPNEIKIWEDWDAG